MSTLRISNIEAKSVPASATIDEKVKITNSSGDTLVFIDGKTSGITTVGINTTDSNITFDANSNVVVTGIITATKFSGQFEPTSVGIADSIFHTGDTNTSINFPSADTVTIETAGDERLRITSDGKIGINANSPASRLAIHDTDGRNLTLSNSWSGETRIGFTGGNAAANGYVNTSTAGALSVTASAPGGAATGYMSFYTNEGDNLQERLRIDSSGSIGVNNTSPTQARFVVQQDSGNTAALIRANNGASLALGGVSQPRILLEAATSASDFIVYTAGGSSWGSPSWAERLRITSGAAEQATLIIDNAQTNGNTWIGDNYTASATEYTCTIGNMYSGAGFFAGYGLKPKSDGWGFVSSTDAYADRKSALTLNGSGYDAFRIDATNANTTHTTGADVTTNKVFAVKHNGDVEIPDGNLVVASGHGIDFSANADAPFGNTSNRQELLDDYEEGQWLPTYSASASGGSVTYSYRKGYYIKVGAQVTVWIEMTISAASGMSGATQIGNLPFNKNDLGGVGNDQGGATQTYYYSGTTNWYIQNHAQGKPIFTGWMPNNANVIRIYNANHWGSVTQAPKDTTGRMSFSYTYTTSA